MQNNHYKVYQGPPPKWYKRHFKTLTRLFAVLLIVSVTGVFAAIQILDTQDAGTLSRTSGASLEVKKLPPIQTDTPENIIDIQSVLDEWAREHQSQHWSVSVQSIEGPTFEAKINQDTQYEVSSMYPVYIALPLFTAVAPEHQARIMLDVDGSRRSMEQCVGLMIRLTNAACANAVSDYVSLSESNDILSKKGLTNTSLTSYLSVKTTAKDSTKFLAGIQGNWLPSLAKNTVLRLLKEHTGKSGIAMGCAGCAVANKTQQNESVANDSAVVTYHRGAYIISVYSKDGSYPQIGELSGKIHQKIAEATY